MINSKKGFAAILAVIMMLCALPLTFSLATATNDGNAEYTVETYLMDLSGKYPTTPTETVTLSAPIGENVTVDSSEKIGFTFAGDKSTASGMVTDDNSLVLKAYYSRNKYNVTYNFEDFTGTQTERSYIYYQSQIPGFESNPSGKPYKEGYTFKMWSSDPDSEVEMPALMPAYDLELYPIYNINTYTFTFDSDGGIFSNGDNILTYEYKYGDTVIVPEAPNKDGSEFIDWDNDIPSTATGNMTFVALYNEILYSVIFMDGENEVYYEDGYVYGDMFDELDVPEGYDAWELADGTAVEFPYTITDNVVFYASTKASESTYTASFYLDYEATVPFDSFTATPGTPIEFPDAPAKTGYIFKGWNSDITEMIDENIDFVAEWEEVTASNENYFKIETALFTQNESGEWVKATSVKRGEKVKARVYLDTGFAAGSGQVIVFYNEDTFTDGYTSSQIYDLIVNDSPTSSTKIHGITGSFGKAVKTHQTITGMIRFGYLTQEFINTHTPITFTFRNASRTCQKISGDEWFAEFELTAKDDAVGEGNFFIVPETIVNEGDGDRAYIDIQRGKEGESVSTAEGMFLWTPEPVVESNPVSTGYGRVTFDADGGIFASNSSNILNADYLVGESISEPEIPVRDGYSFVSWEPSVPDVMTEEVIKCKAIWSQRDDILYTIAVHYVDFSSGEAVDLTENLKFYGAADKKIEIVSEVPAEPDLTVEYITINNLTPPNNTFDASADNVLSATVSADGSTVLHVYFKEISHLVIFDAVYGVFADGSDYIKVNVPHGMTISNYLPDEPTKDGYDFAGWDGIDENTVVNSDLRICAVWEVRSYNVTWIVDGVENQFSYKCGDPIDEFVNPSKEGYRFIGWADKSGVIYESIPGSMPAEDIVFIAKFELCLYNVLFIADGETTVNPTYFGENIAVPESPSKEGYKFVGWYDANGKTPADYETMPARNISFTAKWEPIPTEPSTTEPETTQPETEPETEPTTKPTTAPVTKPTTEPSTKPTTAPVTEPSTTEPVTVPATKPITVPTTEPSTVPVTEPSTTAPVTEPSTTKPITTEPVTTEPSTVPETQPTTEPITKPSTTVHTHRTTTNIINATCTVDGSKKTVCVDCGQVISTEIIKATGHKWSEWTLIENASIDKNGRMERKCSVCGAKEEKTIEFVAVKFSILTPSITTIKYGDSIILHADTELPAGAKVEWKANNTNFSYKVSEDGMTCIITPVTSGNTTFTAYVIDENGNELSEPDTQNMTSKAGFFQKIIAFFKKLFGLNKVIPKAIKTVF